jgi:hypothetical protein
MLCCASPRADPRRGDDAAPAEALSVEAVTATTPSAPATELPLGFEVTMKEQAASLLAHVADSTTHPNASARVAQSAQWFHRSFLALDALSLKIIGGGARTQELSTEVLDDLLAALARAAPQLQEHVFALPLAQTAAHVVHMLYKCVHVGKAQPSDSQAWRARVESWRKVCQTVKATVRKLPPETPTNEVFVQLTLIEEGVSLLTSIVAEGAKSAGRALLSIGKSIITLSPDKDLLGSLTSLAHFGVKAKADNSRGLGGPTPTGPLGTPCLPDPEHPLERTH